MAAYQSQYPSSVEEAENIGKDYPHSRDELTKGILTTKLKSIRLKYRHAVDSGRRSGHGRVVLLYFELCEQLWGGSPATTTLQSGIETAEIEENYQSESASNASFCASTPTKKSYTTSSSLDLADTSDILDQTEEIEPGGVPASVVKERRNLLNAKLKGYKQEKLKRKLPADSQLLNCAQEELKIKRKLIEMMENTEKEHSQCLNKLTSNIEKLSSSIVDGFALLRQSMTRQPLHPMQPMPNYMQSQGSSNYPYPYGHIQSTQSSTRPAMQGIGQFSYTQSVFQDENEDNDCF